MNKHDHPDMFTDTTPVLHKKKKWARTKKTIVASRLDVINIHTLLTKHLIKLPDGMYEYTDHMTDEKLAKLVNPELNRQHVASVRREMFGKVRSMHPLSMVYDLAERVADMEEFLTEGLGYKK